MASTEDARRGGCVWLLAGPALAAVITWSVAAVVGQRWADCPRGMDTPHRATIGPIMWMAWVGMTALLWVLQGALAVVLPKGVEPEVKWVVLIVAAVVLFILFGVAMGSPDASPGGPCYRD
ncbi:hypothetical protein [Kitasatospora sp. NPDC005856]|uniref:hypothetical protein n=1 Tax=Kitasatospora sp. NPDC005856 TaxID=3154566 RepID=UPI0033C83DD6